MKRSQNKKLDFSNQNIFVGIDVHKRNWAVCIYIQDIEHKTMTMDPDPEILIKYLQKNFPNGIYKTAYEAGFSGYVAHEKLTEGGINSMIIHPADVPTTGKEKMQKNDKNDCRKIAKSLKNGELNGIYVPDKFYQEARSFVRYRQELVRDQTRIKNRIKSSLNFYSIKIPEEIDNSHWSGNFIEWLRKIELESVYGTKAIRMRVERLIPIRNEIAKVTREIRKLSKEEEFRENVRLMKTIPGIGEIIAMILLTEIIDINRFKSLDELMSYIGLSPREHSSGTKVHKGGLTKRGNPELRAFLIEASWVAVRKDPALMEYFLNQTKRMSKTRAIIKVAKKLLNRIRYVLINKEEYVIGVA